MLLELLAFALVGLAVGGGAALLLSEYFQVHRAVTVLTGLCSALLIGVLARTVVGSGHLALTVPLSAIGACLLVSLLAHPEQRRPDRQRPEQRHPDQRSSKTVPPHPHHA
jgi:ABC-type Fe3+-siderophore transport system permease subunit